MKNKLRDSCILLANLFFIFLLSAIFPLVCLGSGDYVTEFAHFRGGFSFFFIILTFAVWTGFPLWFSIRRAQGIIKLEKTSDEGEVKQISMFFELAIFIFVIPSIFFAFFVFFNFLLNIFVKDITQRFNLSLQIAAISTDIPLLFYIYLVERKKSH